MSFEHSWCTSTTVRWFRALTNVHLVSDDFSQLVERNTADAQNNRSISGQVDDRRLDTDSTGTAIKYEIDLVSEVGRDVRC